MRPASAPRNRSASVPGNSGRVPWFAFALLLIAPNLALQRLGAFSEFWPLWIGWAALSVVTYLVLASDKRRAQTGQGRIPEATLHTLSLLGGWPGALLAQSRHRHKTAKLGFQLIFWLTVAAHQFAAIDYLLGWPLTSAIKSSIR